MEVFLSHHTMQILLLLAGIITTIIASPTGEISDAERADPDDAIKSIKNGLSSSDSVIEMTNRNIKKYQIIRRSTTTTPSLTDTSSTPALPPFEVSSSTISEPLVEASIPVVDPSAPVLPEKSSETSNIVQKPEQNIFSGLAVSVSQANINTIVMEAFKLAKVSMSLFAHSLANQLSGASNAGLPTLNTTALLGTL